VDRRDTLLYGRMYLPASSLEALYLRRVSPTTQLKFSCVSDSRLKSGGTILALLQNDVGKYSTEYLYSTDSALVGMRGLYNFGPDPRKLDESGDGGVSVGGSSAKGKGKEGKFYGRFSAGAEMYYGALNKSGGSMSFLLDSSSFLTLSVALTYTSQFQQLCASQPYHRTPACH
jgi:mitochondrial distribution and morphology protein 10